jgi:hypothetical protein
VKIVESVVEDAAPDTVDVAEVDSDAEVGDPPVDEDSLDYKAGAYLSPSELAAVQDLRRFAV